MIDLPALPDPLLTVRDGEPFADSRIVAKMFNKRHDNVMRDIRNLIAASKACALNFEEVIEAMPDSRSTIRKHLSYLMNESGFMLLVMGFTGEAALVVKLRFIAAFKTMRDLLNMQREALNERMRDWELRERESMHRGSIGGKALNVRKHEKPALEGERRSILDAVQLTLKLRDGGPA